MSESDSPQTIGTPQPVAWRAYDTDGSEAVFSFYENARAAADEMNWSVEPLYRSPTLTDEEREAISAAACICEDAGHTDIAVIVNTALGRLTIPPLDRTQPSGHPG